MVSFKDLFYNETERKVDMNESNDVYIKCSGGQERKKSHYKTNTIEIFSFVLISIE